jgi:hypothetical protein
MTGFDVIYYFYWLEPVSSRLYIRGQSNDICHFVNLWWRIEQFGDIWFWIRGHYTVTELRLNSEKPVFFWKLEVLPSEKREGLWVLSTNMLAFFYHSAIFLISINGPWLCKLQKKILSGLPIIRRHSSFHRFLQQWVGFFIASSFLISWQNRESYWNEDG